MIRKIFSAGLTLLILSCFLNSCLSINVDSTDQEIYYVGGSGNKNFSSISEAINNSSSGDFIYVYPGVYSGMVVIDKPLTIVGKDKDKTIIDGNGSYYCFSICSNNVSISNFKFKEASIGIYVLDNLFDSNVLIISNSFYNNTNAILLDEKSGSVYVSHNQFINNSEDIRLYNSSENTFYNNYFFNAEEFNIFILDGSNNNLFSENIMRNSGLALSFERFSNKNTFTKNNVSNNENGLSINRCNNVSIVNNIFFNNSRNGISIKDSKNIDITNNNISKTGRYGIYIDNCEDYNITEDNVFIDNNQDIKFKSNPPRIKIPSFEVAVIIILLIFSLVLFFIKVKKDKK